MTRRGRGWHLESYRHALAARGIKVGSRVRFIGVNEDRNVTGRVRDIIKMSDVAPFTKPEEIGYDKYYRIDTDDGYEIEAYPDQVVELRSRGEPIVLGIKGHGSIDGDVKISLEGADELLPLLKSRGVALQAIDAFQSTSGTQKIQGTLNNNASVDLTVTHPGPDQYHVVGDLGYRVDKTFTKQQILDLYNKIKGMRI